MAENVEDYILSAPESVQPKLRLVRKTILEAVPGAKESISYRIPYYAYRGRLAWFGFFKGHISLFIRPPVISQHMKELKGYQTTKSAVHLPLDVAVPVALINKLVRARKKINEVEG